MPPVEDWFVVTQPDFEPACSFTVAGSEQRFEFGVGRTIAGLAIPINPPSEIDLVVSVHFVGPGLDLVASYTGVYARPPTDQKFSLRSAYSDPRAGANAN